MNPAFASSGFSTLSFSVNAFAFDSQKKPGGSSAYSDFDANLAAQIRLARMDQQDLLDIVSILGMLAAQLDDL